MDNDLKKLSGCSVTQRIKQVKQPRGGYINPKNMEVIQCGEGIEALYSEENIRANLTGLAVDYLTRFMSGTPLEEAFKISFMGALIIGEQKKAEELMNDVKGLDDASIINAMKLVGFDVCFRAGFMGYRPVDEIQPDAMTIDNVRVMVKRSLEFLDYYGPKVLDGFTFEGGYTEIISTGDGDFTTSDTLWDFKVSKDKPKKEYTLQLLIYWIMGLQSIHPEFKNIKFLGIYNPRLNCVYRLNVTQIPSEVIAEVSAKVIGYDE